MVGILIYYSSVASAEPETRRSVPIFPALVFTAFKNMKTALPRLAFPINTHQNANQNPIESAPAYRVQCTQPIYQTLLFDFLRVWLRDHAY